MTTNHWRKGQSVPCPKGRFSGCNVTKLLESEWPNRQAGCVEKQEQSLIQCVCVFFLCFVCLFFFPKRAHSLIKDCFACKKAIKATSIQKEICLWLRACSFQLFLVFLLFSAFCQKRFRVLVVISSLWSVYRFSFQLNDKNNFITNFAHFAVCPLNIFFEQEDYVIFSTCVVDLLARVQKWFLSSPIFWPQSLHPQHMRDERQLK